MKKIIICSLASVLMLGVSACAPRGHGAYHKKPGCHKCAKHEAHGKKHCDCKKCKSKKKCPHAM